MPLALQARRDAGGERRPLEPQCLGAPLRAARRRDPALRDGSGRARVGLGTAARSAAASTAAAEGAARLECCRLGPPGRSSAQPGSALLQPGGGGEDLGHGHLRGARARGQRAAPTRALLQVGGGPSRLRQRPHHPGPVLRLLQFGGPQEGTPGHQCNRWV